MADAIEAIPLIGFNIQTICPEPKNSTLRVRQILRTGYDRSKGHQWTLHRRRGIPGKGEITDEEKTHCLGETLCRAMAGAQPEAHPAAP